MLLVREGFIDRDGGATEHRPLTSLALCGRLVRERVCPHVRLANLQAASLSFNPPVSQKVELQV